MRKSFVTAACAVLFASGLGSAAPASAASVMPPPDYTRALQYTPTLVTPSTLGACPSVIAYVNRGAGENSDAASADYANRDKYYGGVGEEMSPLVNYLRALYGTGFKAVANLASPVAPTFDAPSYPAADLVQTAFQGTFPNEFMDSIYWGAQRAILDLNAINTACPNTKLVVIGYSQGAIVARLAVGSATSPVNGRALNFSPAAGRATLLTFGDATWNRSVGVFNGSYVGDTLAPGALPAGDEEGIASWIYSHNVSVTRRALLRPPATPSVWNLTTWCHGTDPVCQFAHQSGQAANGLPGHLYYDSQDFFGAADRAATVFASGPAPIRALVPTPSVDLTAYTRSCVARNTTTYLTATSAGSEVGSAPVTYTSAWRPSLASTDARVTPSSVAVAAGGLSVLSARSTSNVLLNDVWRVTADAPVAGAGARLIVFEGRVCPA